MSSASSPGGSGVGRGSVRDRVREMERLREIERARTMGGSASGSRSASGSVVRRPERLDPPPITPIRYPGNTARHARRAAVTDFGPVLEREPERAGSETDSDYDMSADAVEPWSGLVREGWNTSLLVEDADGSGFAYTPEPEREPEGASSGTSFGEGIAGIIGARVQVINGREEIVDAQGFRYREVEKVEEVVEEKKEKKGGLRKIVAGLGFGGGSRAKRGSKEGGMGMGSLRDVVDAATEQERRRKEEAHERAAIKWAEREREIREQGVARHLTSTSPVVTQVSQFVDNSGEENAGSSEVYAEYYRGLIGSHPFGEE